MNRIVIAATVVVAAVLGFVAASLLYSRSAAPALPPTDSAARLAELTRSLEDQKRALSSCRSDREELEAELRAMQRAQSSNTTPRSVGAGTPDSGSGVAAVVAATATGNGRTRLGRLPAAAWGDERTNDWIDHVVGDLALSGRKKAELNDIAKWAADQREALKARAEKEQLDSDAVRGEIAQQREEYETRMKALLSADEWLAFDAVQGMDRRPPTFARVPDILGDQAQPNRPAAKRDAGG